MTTIAKSSHCYAHDYRTEYSACQADTKTMHSSYALISSSFFLFLSFIFAPLCTTIILG